MKESFLFLTISLVSISLIKESYAKDIQFNTDLLDVMYKESIDSGFFKNPGYILPGKYEMQLVVNNSLLGEREVTFFESTEGASLLCLTAELTNDLGLKKKELEQLSATSSHNGGCYDQNLLEGIVIKGDLSKDTLTISIPNAYRDYRSDFWDPPSHWDEGVNGALLDYGINLQKSYSEYGNGHNTNASGYGVVGINTGPWRLRADWQGLYQDNKNQDGAEHSESELSVNRVYAYRALPEFKAKLMLGEQDLGNSRFDSFQFTGASVVNDDNMLPPDLRGYAPEVVGVAKTNAKVVISQQGRVIYETQVASGPFRIQEISNAVSGTLDVRIEEQDGSVTAFKVNTANVPYLSRPGSVRYKFYSGKVSSEPHQLDGPAFAGGEFSWGVNNGWSLLGGSLNSNNYNAMNIGVGRSLLNFGAISFDITTSRAKLVDETKIGRSYRVNYSKNFEEYDSQVAFSGYRFSEHDFMNMNDFMSAKSTSYSYPKGDKEMYQVILSKQFKGVQTGVYLDYTYHSYWSQMNSERASLSLSHNFDFMGWRGLSAYLTAYRNKQDVHSENGINFTLNVPFGRNNHMSYGTLLMDGKTTNNISVFDNIDARNSYSLTASTSPNGKSVSGFYTHTGDTAKLMANFSHQAGSSTAAGFSINGGVTATAEGVAMHRVGMVGGSRIMIDTDGVANVPVQSIGLSTFTNYSGKAVVADISSYYRQRTSIDVDQVGEDVEPIGSPVSTGTLTEGAIGYRHFDMLSGSKRMLELVQQDGRVVPFASEVINEKGQQLGMVADGGMVYLVGLHEGYAAEARWGDNQHCRFYLPSPLPAIDVIAKLTCH